MDPPPFGNFPKIHPIWWRDPSLRRKLEITKIIQVEDLANQVEIKYGCMGGGSTSNFFKVSSQMLLSNYHRDCFSRVQRMAFSTRCGTSWTPTPTCSRTPTLRASSESRSPVGSTRSSWRAPPSSTSWSGIASWPGLAGSWMPRGTE